PERASAQLGLLVDLERRPREPDEADRDDEQARRPVRPEGQERALNDEARDAQDVAHDRQSEDDEIRRPAVEGSRPFARERQRDERERGEGREEDEDAARLEGVAADRRQPVRAADGPPGQDTPDEHDQGAHRGEAPAPAERTAVHPYSPL